MKNLLRPALAVAALAVAIACGSAVQASDNHFDPMAAYGQARALAAGFTADPRALSLSATQKPHSKSAQAGSFTWVWTLVGQDGTFVDVEVSPAGAHVLAHEPRALWSRQATFDPAKVAVSGSDVLAIAMQQKIGEPTDLFLGANVVGSGASELRWAVGFQSGQLDVDGDSGDIVK